MLPLQSTDSEGPQPQLPIAYLHNAHNSSVSDVQTVGYVDNQWANFHEIWCEGQVIGPNLQAILVTTINLTVLWHVTPYTLANSRRHFGRTCYLHHQSILWRISLQDTLSSSPSKYHIKKDLEHVRWVDVKWIPVAQDTDMTGCCEYDNEPHGSVKCGKCLDWTEDCQLLSQNSAASH